MPAPRILLVEDEPAIADALVYALRTEGFAPEWCSTGTKALLDVLKALESAGIHALDVGLKRPSLDDVFLSLTGHTAEVNTKSEMEESK